MQKLAWFLTGVVSIAVLLVVIALTFVKAARGFSTLTAPSKFETLLAEEARNMALPRNARDKKNPIASSNEVLAEARAHWADHCAVCHANDGGGQTELGAHLYPPAPDMRLQHTQGLTDGELFYIIENGVRLSGMPGWGGSKHGEADSWKLVVFIRHLPSITQAEVDEMEKLNPKTPEEREEEEQEQQFLSGQSTTQGTGVKHTTKEK